MQKALETESNKGGTESAACGLQGISRVSVLVETQEGCAGPHAFFSGICSLTILGHCMQAFSFLVSDTEYPRGMI